MERARVPIDWQQVRERLARRSSRERDADEVRRSLEERARRLAARVLDAPTPAMPAIAFAAEGEPYALLTSELLRIERTASIVRVPGAPFFVLGVVPVRNRAWTLLHLPSLLGRATTPAAAPRWALLLATGAARFALGADEIGLVELSLAALHPAGGADPVRRGWTGDARVVLDGKALVDLALARLRGSAP